jgi:hypothetical protein
LSTRSGGDKRKILKIGVMKTVNELNGVWNYIGKEVEVVTEKGYKATILVQRREWDGCPSGDYVSKYEYLVKYNGNQVGYTITGGKGSKKLIEQQLDLINTYAGTEYLK